jgi:hypothetical protein
MPSLFAPSPFPSPRWGEGGGEGAEYGVALFGFGCQPSTNPPLPPEAVKKSPIFVSPVKTGVQGICKPIKALDSGFRRNDTEQNQTSFFHSSPLLNRGDGGMRAIVFSDFNSFPNW